MDFKQKLKDVPENPGVYMMLNSDNNIIYVGKAKNLRKRLRQYFYVSKTQSSKVICMIQNIVDFKYIICASEVDALVTENNLIKKHTPKYNILLKDDKTYPFIRIDIKQKYPKIELCRALKSDGAKYFGPYMLSVRISDIFDLVYSAFRVRECSRDLQKQSRPCLNNHLDRCLAPCTGKISEEQYKLEIDKVISFLKGNDRQVEKILTQKMLHFASLENFEVAQTYKNKLQVLDKLVRKQVSALPTHLNLDIFALDTNGLNTAVSILNVRAGKLVGGENIAQNSGEEDLTTFVYQYYVKNPPLCDEIILDVLDGQDALENAINELCGHTVRVIQPKQGVRKQLLELAHSNCSDALEKFGTAEQRKHTRTTGAVRMLQEILNLEIMPKRMECFDISHISGTDKVASMVVFENGEPKKSHYRKFKIKTVEGNNDFESMKEVLSRRLLRIDSDDDSFSTIPDLIVVDGGKGQLTYGIEALRENSREDLQMIALAERDEIVFQKSNPTTPIYISKDSVALQLLQRLRDEAHRFAVSYHRTLRAKHLQESALRNIEGIGDKKCKSLLKHFGSIEDIKRSTIDEICKVEGFSKKSAEKLLSLLNN